MEAIMKEMVSSLRLARVLRFLVAVGCWSSVLLVVTTAVQQRTVFPSRRIDPETTTPHTNPVAYFFGTVFIGLA